MKERLNSRTDGHVMAVSASRASRGRTVAILAALSAATLLNGACSPPETTPVKENPRHPGRFYLDFETMGTRAHIEVVCPRRKSAARMIEAAVAKLKLVNRRMSTYLEDSEISRLNREGAEGPVLLSAETFTVLEKAVYFASVTGGAFDVTYAPLRQLWWEAQKRDAVPGDAEIEAALRLVGIEGLILRDGAARFATPGMQVDLGGIAKGYAIDLAAQAIRSAGARGALVDVGGDMRLIGSREDGQDWKIQINCPPGVTLRPAAYLGLREIAVATSGDYARYFTVGGRHFSHIIDPRTGWPVRNMPSVTVVASDALTADALATGASVMGPEAAIKLVDTLEGVECMIMARMQDNEVKTFHSKGFLRYVSGEQQWPGQS